LGAEVIAYDTANKDNTYKTRTDANGYYELDLDPGNYYITISKDGYVAQKESMAIDGPVEHDVKLTPGSGGGKDPPKKDYPKKDKPKDGLSDSVLLGIVGASVAVIVLIVIFLASRKSGQRGSRTRRIKKDTWTTCPKCGTDLKMRDLSTHLESVHPKLSKAKREQLLEERLKQ